MYTRILVPLDGSDLAEQALPYARLFARAFESRIELLRVIEPLPPVGLTDPAHETYREGYLATMSQEVQEYLDGIAARLTDDGLKATHKVHGGPVVESEAHLGNPALHILSEAAEDPSTLIAMSTHGRSGIARWVLGSTTDKVLRATGNPMLVIRSREPAPELEVKLETVIVPLDGSLESEMALPHAAALARSMSLKIVVTRVTPALGDYYRYLARHPLDTLSTFHQGPYEEHPQESDAQATKYLREVAESLHRQGIEGVEYRLLFGHPAGAIIDIAQEFPRSLVAMSTHGRSGISRWVMGSVTDRVARHAGGPVLVIRAVAEDRENEQFPNMRIRPA